MGLKRRVEVFLDICRETWTSTITLLLIYLHPDV